MLRFQGARHAWETWIDHRVSGFTGLITLLTIVGCTEFEPMEPDNPNRSSAALAPIPEGLVGIDRAFAEIAREVPDFAGLYHVSGGGVVVRLAGTGNQNMSTRNAVRSLVMSRLQTRGVSPTELTYRDAEFTFPQLAEWRIKLRDLFVDNNVTSLGIDERANRIKIGLADLSREEQTFGDAGTLGVPSEAIIVVEEAPAVSYADLNTSRIRPVPGGMRIVGHHPTTGACTHGFNAYVYGDPHMGFVTAAHCSGQRGVVDYTDYYQPATSSNNEHIGVEIEDPPFFTGGQCPAGKRCRYSDALFATYYDASGQIGKIARPYGRQNDGDAGGTTINNSHPRLLVLGKYEFPHQGEVVDKVGITTGWTAGRVFDSCTDIPSGNNTIFWCQDKVRAVGWYGDSGAPTFFYQGNGRITLVGMLWGGPGNPNNRNEFWMSPMIGIDIDGIDIDIVCCDP